MRIKTSAGRSKATHANIELNFCAARRDLIFPALARVRGSFVVFITS